MKAIVIMNFVETTCLYHHTWQIEISYERIKKLLVLEFRNTLIVDEYRIKSKPATSGNPQDNSIIKQLHQVLGIVIITLNIDKITMYMRFIFGKKFYMRQHFTYALHLILLMKISRSVSLWKKYNITNYAYSILGSYNPTKIGSNRQE